MRVVLIAVVCATVGCVRPGDERVVLDDEVGQGTLSGTEITVASGDAAILPGPEDSLILWAQAPVLDIELRVQAGGRTNWLVEVRNCLPDAELVATTSAGVPLAQVDLPGGASPTVRRWQVELGDAPVARLRVAPADADVVEGYQFAVLGDVQTAIPSVHEVFARINQDPNVRFVVSTGDLVEEGEKREYDAWLAQLQTLNVPLYATVGNHELDGEPRLWHELFGRFTVHFEFKGAVFSFVDSGNASIDPVLYRRLDGWLDEAADKLHFFGTHYPPFDPIGVRSAGFRSRREASKLAARLAEHGVDVTFYGHIHSYYAYSNAGIPAFISGGGGALPERLDGIGRHYLRVDADPGAGTAVVGFVPVD